MTTTLSTKDPDTAITQSEQTRTGPVFRPHVDIIERSNELLLIADMPGATADAINIQFERGELTINAHVPPRQAPDAHYLAREYGVGAFHRTFRVGEGIDAEKIDAEVNAGVLTLHLPKAESAKPRQIKVKSN